MTRLEIPEIEILREEPIKGFLRETIYSITNKGKRLLEISEHLSDEEANEFLRVSSRQLEILRAILKEGPKHVSDFSHESRCSLRYSLDRMVDGGFLHKIRKGFDLMELRRMRDEGLTNQKIAENLGISVPIVQHWVKKLNLENRSKGRQVDWTKSRADLYQLLKGNGPIPKTEAIEALGYSSKRIDEVLMMFPEEFQSLTFVRSGRTRNRMFYDLVKASPVLTLKGDPRIVDFAASHILLKVETQYDAKAVVHLLKWQIGYCQAREVVERLGYRYKRKLAS